MKQIKVLSVLTMGIISFFAFALTSCDKEVDQPSNVLKLSTTQVNVATGATASVIIRSGTAPYKVESSAAKVATATVKDKAITINGLTVGNAWITVTDKSKTTSKIAVSVVEALAIDKASIEVNMGKSDVVTILKGKSPYTATPKDKTIATASVKDNKVTVNGVKAGSTTITVSDKNKTSVTIKVTVK